MDQGLDHLSSLTIEDRIELCSLDIVVHMPHACSIDLLFILSGSH